MKRILLFILLLSLIFCFVGCGQEETVNTEPVQYIDELSEVTIPEETIIELEKFYFEMEKNKFDWDSKWEQFSILNPIAVGENSLEDMLKTEKAEFKIENNRFAFNNFSVEFYKESETTEEKDIQFKRIKMLPDNKVKPLNIIFPNEIKLGSGLQDVLKAYGKPNENILNENIVESIIYRTDDNVYSLELFFVNGKLTGFEMGYQR